MQSSRGLSDTCTGTPSLHVPLPTSEVHILPVNGLWTTPMYGSPSLNSATDTPTSGMPLEKFMVPSMGSTIQVYPSSRMGDSSPSSPTKDDPGTSDVSLDLRNASFSTSAEVTMFSLVPFSSTENERAAATLRPDSATMSAMRPSIASP